MKLWNSQLNSIEVMYECDYLKHPPSLFLDFSTKPNKQFFFSDSGNDSSKTISLKAQV